MTKLTTTMLLLVFAAISLLASVNSSLSPKNTLCQHFIVKQLLHWNSGCVYKAYFMDAPSQELILDEQARLKKFSERGGVAADILWYRSVFHQRFQNELRTSFQDIHEMHQRYTRAQHIRIDFQTAYLDFLVRSDLIPLAQTTLDEYCTTYIEPHRADLVTEIKWRLSRRNLDLSLDTCEAKVR